MEAAVPLQKIGLHPIAGLVTRGDVGVIFSDAAGTVDVLRVRYANKYCTVVNDVPTEAKISPNKWAVLRFE